MDWFWEGIYMYTHIPPVATPLLCGFYEYKLYFGFCRCEEKIAGKHTHRRKSSVIFLGKTFLPENICMKNKQNARILHEICHKKIWKCPFSIFARKIYQFLEFYMIIARKMFSQLFGGGHVPPAPFRPQSPTTVNIHGVGVTVISAVIFSYNFIFRYFDSWMVNVSHEK